MNELYELAEQYEYLSDMLDQFYKQQEEETDEFSVDEKTIKDTLESLDYEIEEKADGIAKIIMNKKAAVEALKKEETRLKNRRQAQENGIEYLKKYLQANLEFIGKTKFKTLLFSYTIAINGGKQPLFITENTEEIPGKYLIPQPPIPDGEAIRELLEKKEVDWAHLEPKGRSLRIR